MIVRTRWQYRVLAEMQRALRCSDPRLVARFTIFTRLTLDEDIPPFERVRSWIGRRAVMIVRRRPRIRRRDARARWRLGGILVGAATLVGLFAFVLVTGTVGHTSPNCAPAAAARSQTRPNAVFTARGEWLLPGCSGGGR